MPGEHVFEYEKYDMEIQFYCSKPDPSSGSGKTQTFVAIPARRVKNYISQSTFFEDIDKALSASKSAQLPVEILINSFYDALNPFNMFSKIFYYSGTLNYPECDVNIYWIVIENPLSIKEKTYDKLFSFLDKTKIDDGNYRIATQKFEDGDLFFLENKFKN